MADDADESKTLYFTTITMQRNKTHYIQLITEINAQGNDVYIVLTDEEAVKLRDELNMILTDRFLKGDVAT